MKTILKILLLGFGGLLLIGGLGGVAVNSGFILKPYYEPFCQRGEETLAEAERLLQSGKSEAAIETMKSANSSLEACSRMKSNVKFQRIVSGIIAVVGLMMVIVGILIRQKKVPERRI